MAINSAVASYVVHHNSDSWSEQDPMHRIDALEKTIKEISTSCSEFKNIKGIGVAGHMHGATLIDKNNDPLRHCILWNDTRSMN